MFYVVKLFCVVLVYFISTTCGETEKNICIALVSSKSAETIFISL